MSDTEVPDGTAAEVLAWVDDDPQRAQTALEAETCKDQPRSTLVSKLEAIIAKEEPVSPTQPSTQSEEQPDYPGTEPVDRPAGGQATSTTSGSVDERGDGSATSEDLGPDDDAQAEQEELAPEQPTEIEIYAEDAGTVIHGPLVRDFDVEVPDDAVIAADPQYDRTPEAAQARARASLDDGDVEPISAESVEFITAASGTYGLVLNLNGTTFGLNAQQAAQLKQVVDKTVIGLAL